MLRHKRGARTAFSLRRFLTDALPIVLYMSASTAVCSITNHAVLLCGYRTRLPNVLHRAHDAQTWQCITFVDGVSVADFIFAFKSYTLKMHGSARTKPCTFVHCTAVRARSKFSGITERLCAVILRHASPHFDSSLQQARVLGNCRRIELRTTLARFECDRGSTHSTPTLNSLSLSCYLMLFRFALARAARLLAACIFYIIFHD